MLLNRRKIIADFLKTKVSYPVMETMLDPFTPGEGPAVTVQYRVVDKEQIGTDWLMRCNATIDIVIIVAKAEGYDLTLDTAVNAVNNAMLKDISWIDSMDVEEISPISQHYNYYQGGKENVAHCVLALHCVFIEHYVPVITAVFEKMHVDTDLRVSEEDIVIDATQVINIPQ